MPKIFKTARLHIIQNCKGNVNSQKSDKLELYYPSQMKVPDNSKSFTKFIARLDMG